MGSALLNFEELTTLLAQIEACLNSRPLYPLSEDPEDLQALTPGHFLIGGSLTALPDEDDIIAMSLPNRWQLIQKSMNHFWTRWSQNMCTTSTKIQMVATETYELIKEAFGDAALSCSSTFEWFSRFLKGREKVNDDQNTGSPRSLRCEENKLKIKELIKSNRIISIKDLSSETGLSVGLCHQIVTKDLDMIRTSSKFVPRILTEEQKEVRMDVCKNMIEMTRTDPEWMQKIITGDETWVYQYDPETKRQSSQWIERGEPKPKKARFAKSKVKTLLVNFFDINGLVHHEFIPFGRTINQEVYLGIMRRLREAGRLKRPERWQNNDWILHVDNARSHTAHVVLQFLAKHSTIHIPHPPYSPDLAPNDFFLYSILKMKLKGRKFDNVDMIQAESKATLRNLSKSDFISCFDNWKKR
ncbi:hypothetical protein LAZ67_2005309 [Cordylochernes scorpioides]|uniref:Mos1 transposase HTH domain-containing protein n=1 Tax=Cordylochernes scorpioides TaxID=51811 RepID=A0ABY6K495_9ARAC|nr:hypothetical protein LAZ67_2005309 [Cordylochernes scorpioides]